MQLLDVAELRRRLVDPWTSPPVAPEMLAAVAEEVGGLARRAYIDDDRGARAQAEALLYFINIDNCFAPPLDAVGSLVWTTLTREKLAALRRQFGGCEPIDAAEMRKRLHAAVERWGAYNHPVLNTLRAHPENLRAYKIWATNWYGSCVGFSAQLAALVQRTSGEPKKIVIENLADEFDDKVTHDEIRVRFYESLGLRFKVAEALDDPDRVLEATELLNARTGLTFSRDPVAAFGAFFGVEANWPPECRIHLEVNRARGADDHTLEYWLSHAFADEHHSAEWLEALDKLCKSPRDCATAVDGCVLQLRLRWKMYDSIAERVAAAMKGSHA